MKQNIFMPIMIFLLMVMMFSAQAPAQEPDEVIRVMTYNIWNGFDWGKDTLRKKEWMQWIKDKSPDVLALQELCGYDHGKLQAEAATWGHHYVEILKTDGYPVGITSRRPIQVKERVLDGLWHGMLHCETYGLDFFVVHLSPADCDFRLKEAGVIVKKIKESQIDRFLVLGDFNAHSPFDQESLKHNHILKEKYLKGKSDQYSNLRLGQFDYSVVSAFLAIPTVDVSNRFIDLSQRYTFPTAALIGSYRNSMDEVIQTRERIDYILTSPALSRLCTHVTIFNQGDTETFSDHYPLMAEFSITPK